tara:strand:+ start:110 stop:1222 length:1113 start_codon:yes stop_codon:yes gene_type:complete
MSSSNTDKQIGFDLDNPILMSSIPASYVYLDALCSLMQGLEYNRIGPVNSMNFPEVIDKYSFTMNGSSFCELYIYPYHSENLNFIPAIFKDLNPDATDEIFNIQERHISRYLFSIVNLILIKNNKFGHSNENWTDEKQIELQNLLRDVGYEDELEKLTLDEFSNILANTPAIQKMDFIQLFVNRFHNKKLSQYTPQNVQDRNVKIASAYNSIIITINKLQAWSDNDLVRRRLEISTSNISEDNRLGYSKMNNCITPFCFISLGCDMYGKYSIAYGIDARILNMVPDGMASTLLRRIYEFTPGEMEPFVGFVSLDMDCITYFEETHSQLRNENGYNLIEVERHKEKSIADMLSKLKLKDDVDEETKKWFNR